MILNRLVVPEGNNIRFCLEHKEDGNDYTLKDGEKYYFKVKYGTPTGDMIFECVSETNFFDTVNKFDCGTYAFEVGIRSGADSRVILPAFDDRLMPLNELIILRRIKLDE